MARKKITNPSSPTKLISCLTCANCDILQWGNDPLIADCKPCKSREVASIVRTCSRYEKAKVIPKPIKHFEKYAGLLGPKKQL